MPKDVFCPLSLKGKQVTIAFYFEAEIENCRNKGNNHSPFY